MNDTSKQNEASLTRKVTWYGLAVNIILSALKVTAGILARSQALLADGLHSLSDMTTDVAILIGAGYWNEPADDSHPYGHGRLETLINIGIGIVLALTGLGIAWRALASIFTSSGDSMQNGWIVLVIALTAMLLKEILYRWTFAIGEKIGSQALKSNAWHHRSDALSSIPVALSVLCAWFFPRFHYFDNIAAMIVAAMIAKVSWDIVRPSIRELLESGDLKLCERVKRLADRREEICEIHAVRSRRVGKSVLVDFHMLVDPKMNVDEAHAIAEKFKHDIIEMESELADAVIHIEPCDRAGERKRNAD